MSLFCYACHRISEEEKTNCTYDSFELVEADCSLPAPTEIDGLKLEYQECIFPGEHIKAYKVRTADDYEHLVLATISSKIVNDEQFNAWFSKRKELKHEHVTSCIKYGALPTGVHYVISEHPYGESILEHLQDDGEMNAKICIYVADQILDALIGLRDQGVFHGNLMPSKCLLVDDPSNPNQVKVGGISLPEECFTNLEDKPGKRYAEIISPLYVSPERVQGKPACESSEMYSIGAIMYECLSGIPAYTAKSRDELLQKLTEGQLLPLRGVAPGLAIPPMIDEFVLKAMSKDPKDRFSSFEEMQKELLRAARKSRIYLPDDEDSKFTPKAITEEFSIPKLVQEEIAREREEKEEEIKEEAEKIDAEIENKVKNLQMTSMILAVIAIAAIASLATVFLNQ